MKTNLKYAVWNLLLSAMGVSFSLIGIIVFFTEEDSSSRYLWVSIFLCIFFFSSFVMLLFSIRNIQWCYIADGYINIYCPFGLIKQVRIDKIKKVFIDNAVIFHLKMTSFRRPHIVLCQKKSIRKADVEDAYNRKKQPYVIIPYSVETANLIRAEYKKVCGEELIIK